MGENTPTSLLSVRNDNAGRGAREEIATPGRTPSMGKGSPTSSRAGGICDCARCATTLKGQVIDSAALGRDTEWERRKPLTSCC